MSERDLESLLATYDERAKKAQIALDQQRAAAAQFKAAVDDWLRPLLDRVAARLEQSGHEAEVTVETSSAMPDAAMFSHHAELRILPRALPGQRAVRPADRQPLVRFQLDALDNVVRVWARDVSLDGRDVLVGYRNDDSGQPLGLALDALNADFVWRHVLITIGFAMRESAQEPLFPTR